MKIFCLILALLCVSTLAVQVHQDAETKKQISRQPSSSLLDKKSASFLSKKALAKQENQIQEPLESVATLFQYYLDDTIFESIVQTSFVGVDANQNGVIEKAEYNTALQAEQVAEIDANRIWDLVTVKDTILFAEFEEITELIYHEILSVITYVFIRGDAEHSRNDGVSLGQLESGLKLIFGELSGGYPLPRCRELAFLFQQCDIDANGLLNVEEFFYVLSIFLRFYKSGVENNLYSHLILSDDVFERLWRKEDLEEEHSRKLQVFRESFYSFFALAVDEKSLTQVSHEIFSAVDTDHNGAIDGNEFYQALSNFGVSSDESSLLFALGDTDASGDVDFGEFTILLETFVRRATATFGYFYIAEVGGEVNLSLTYTLFFDVVSYLQLTPVSDADFRGIFANLDADGDGLLDANQFIELTSAVISSLRQASRQETDNEIVRNSAIA